MNLSGSVHQLLIFTRQYTCRIEQESFLTERCRTVPSTRKQNLQLQFLHIRFLRTCRDDRQRQVQSGQDDSRAIVFGMYCLCDCMHFVLRHVRQCMATVVANQSQQATNEFERRSYNNEVMPTRQPHIQTRIYMCIYTYTCIYMHIYIYRESTFLLYCVA